MKFLFKYCSIIALSFFMAVPLAQADLFISPLRVVFDGRDRSALVTLVNRSDEINTYRIFWQDKQYSNEKSNYIDIEELGTAGGGVSEMVRYSPRQITLKPGENQKIRLAVRKPADLASGEYRSHLVFQKIPNIPAETLAKQEGATMRLYVNLSFAIPIFVRENITNDSVKASITNASLTKDEDDNSPLLNVSITKEGAQTAYGKIVVYNMEEGATEGSVVGILNNAAVLKENNKRSFVVDLDEGPITGNRLYVVYKGAEEYSGITWSEQIINLN